AAAAAELLLRVELPRARRQRRRSRAGDELRDHPLILLCLVRFSSSYSGAPSDLVAVHLKIRVDSSQTSQSLRRT
ncbi:unnamed protein product, partial [Urochloa humidicola]